jgi:hypothetical protein
VIFPAGIGWRFRIKNRLTERGWSSRRILGLANAAKLRAFDAMVLMQNRDEYCPIRRSMGSPRAGGCDNLASTRSNHAICGLLKYPRALHAATVLGLVTHATAASRWPLAMLDQPCARWPRRRQVGAKEQATQHEEKGHMGKSAIKSLPIQYVKK